MTVLLEISCYWHWCSFIADTHLSPQTVALQKSLWHCTQTEMILSLLEFR